MNYGTSGSSNAPLPAWATRTANAEPSWATMANQPLVAASNLTAEKKQIKLDLKEIRLAVDSIARLSRKRGIRDNAPKVLQLSDQVRRQARSATGRIRDALSTTAEGSADHTSLTKLGEELKGVLCDFQKNVEVVSSSAETSSTASTHQTPHSVALEIDHDGSGGGSDQGGQLQLQHCCQDVATQEQLQAVATNETILAAREVGIEGIAKSVQELHEIFEACALLPQSASPNPFHRVTFTSTHAHTKRLRVLPPTSSWRWQQLTPPQHTNLSYPRHSRRALSSPCVDTFATPLGAGPQCPCL